MTHRNRKAFGREIGGLLAFVLALLLALLVTIALLVFGIMRPLIVRVFYVPTPSMVPAPKVGEWMLANEFIYGFAEPVREDHRI